MRACSRKVSTSASSRPFWYWSRYRSAATRRMSGSALTRRIRCSSGETQRSRCAHPAVATGDWETPPLASGMTDSPAGRLAGSALLVAVADPVERLDLVEGVVDGPELFADAF